MRTPNGVYIDNPSTYLVQAGITYWGITTGAGAAIGNTLVCADLLTQPTYDGLTVKLLNGAAAGQVKTISVHPAPSDTLVVGSPFTDNAGALVQVPAGTLFVIGSQGSVGSIPSPEEGLVYYGVVTAIGANQFTIPTLAGLGAGKFADATNPYSAFVLRETTGASIPPQGEFQDVTAYVTATGLFTTNAFTAAVAVGDEILIMNPAIAGVIGILANLLVPAIDSVANILERDVIGNKEDTANIVVGLTSSLMRYVKGILNQVNIILALVNAIFTLKETGGTVTTTGAVQDVYRVETPLGVFTPKYVNIDFTLQTAAETVVVQYSERIIAGGAYVVMDTVTYAGVQAVPGKKIKLTDNRFGVLVTMQRTVGGAIAYPWQSLYKD